MFIKLSHKVTGKNKEKQWEFQRERERISTLIARFQNIVIKAALLASAFLPTLHGSRFARPNDMYDVLS